MKKSYDISDKDLVNKLKSEIEELKSRLDESEETLKAIRNGDVDAIIVNSSEGEKVFSLTTSETPYRIIIEQINEGAVTVSSKGIILYCNQRFSEIIGNRYDKLIGSEFSSFISPDDKPEFKRLLRLSQKKATRGEVTTKVDGKNIYLNLSMVPLPSRMEGDICIIVSDVTEMNNYQNYLLEIVDYRTSEIKNANKMLSEELQKLITAEKKLKESEERYSLAVKAANLGTFDHTVTPKGIEIIWSDYMFKLFGLEKRENFTQEDFIRQIHPDDMDYLKHEMEFAINRNTGHEIEFRVIWPNGSVRWIHASFNISFDARSQTTRINGIARDITKRTIAEIKLRESERRYNIALENGQIGTWEWNFKTNRIIWDERMERMFGLKKGTFGGDMASFEALIHEEDLPHVRAAIKDSLDKNTTYETIYRTKPVNGESSFITAKALINLDKNGNPESMAGVCFDVTGMKKGAEQALIKLNENLLRSNTDLQQFAYVASHDLQEPLRMISSFTQLLQKRYNDKLDAQANEYIRYAVDGAKRMYELLNGLLAYSRVQSKGREFGEVDMNEVVNKVKSNLSLVIEETGAILNIQDLPVIFADENQMIQLVQNLVENSIKFSKEKPEIYISSKKENDFVIFSINDKGIGIEPQYFERIFRIFQRLHRSDEYEGTGIGLAICKRIVERHGGHIWVESIQGEETTFNFSIPITSSNNLV
ncbi:MAG TPA: PAS domain-containing protein [Bacteroidales bacterium]|nr:PAS domain-containing protein [Bacteroidales bacterium]